MFSKMCAKVSCASAVTSRPDSATFVNVTISMKVCHRKPVVLHHRASSKRGATARSLVMSEMQPPWTVAAKTICNTGTC